MLKCRIKPSNYWVTNFLKSFPSKRRILHQKKSNYSCKNDSSGGVIKKSISFRIKKWQQTLTIWYQIIDIYNEVEVKVSMRFSKCEMRVSIKCVMLYFYDFLQNTILFFLVINQRINVTTKFWWIILWCRRPTMNEKLNMIGVICVFHFGNRTFSKLTKETFRRASYRSWCLNLTITSR